MNKTRLEAFSDGVLAIIITIMVLEFKLPEGADCGSLRLEFLEKSRQISITPKLPFLSCC